MIYVCQDPSPRITADSIDELEAFARAIGAPVEHAGYVVIDKVQRRKAISRGAIIERDWGIFQARIEALECEGIERGIPR